jgi:hypothetical protein
VTFLVDGSPLQGDAKAIRILSEAWIGQPVAQLEDILDEPADQSLSVSLGPDVMQRLNEENDDSLVEGAVFITRAQLVGILDTVRNRILGWSLEAQKNGIVGEGYQFGVAEKETAQTTGSTFHVQIDTFAGTLGSHNLTEGQRITQTVNQAKVFEQLTAALRSGIEDGLARDALLAAVGRMQASTSTPSAFAAAYSDFVAKAADHLTIVLPFLPALTHLLG